MADQAAPAAPAVSAASPAFQLTDTTLRDGSHAVSHTFTPDQVSLVAGALDRAGVPVIEVSHGDGLGGSSFNYGFGASVEMDLLTAAVAAVRTARIAVLLLPGIGVADDLRLAADVGVQVARVATHCTEADIAEEHLRVAKSIGLETVGFLMMSHMISPSELLVQAKKMESYGADCVYVVDSAGAMTEPQVRARVELLSDRLGCQIGVHAHDNLSLGVANSLAAVEVGATQVDGCLAGLGAGAGNCPIEVLVAVCNKLDISTGVDAFALMDAAEDLVRPLMRRPQEINRTTLMLGYAGVYSSFLLHAERASQRFGVDVKDILVELGRRQVVGGQEDMIVDVAVEIATQKQAVPEQQMS
jgi:4-hydroxy 2-oxovalerate aldolase